MRKISIIIWALGLVVGACSGGASGATTTTTTQPPAVSTTSTTPPSTMVVEPEPITTEIVIWAPSSLIGPLGDASAAFEIETGIDVQISPAEVETLLDILLEDPSAGPDVFVGPHHWLIPLTDAGIAEPIVVDPTVVAGAAAGVERRGSTFAAPIGLDTIAQFRSPALSTSPTTVESFESGCSVGGATRPCLALSEVSVDGHWPFVTALGGYLFGPDQFEGWDKGDVGLDTTEALAGGLILERVVDGTGILGDGGSTARDRFAAGEAPLFWGTTADLTELEAAGVEFTVEELPSIGNLPAAGPVTTVALWVNGFSSDKEAAVELVQEHLAVPANARTFAIALGLAPVDFDFTDDADLAPFTRMGRLGLPVPPIAATDVAWEELAIAFEEIRSGGTAESALRAAAATIRARG